MGRHLVASVIVVTYNSSATIASCLNSIPHDCEVVLVDHSSHDDTVAVAQALRHDIHIISAGANRGYGAGCNLGAANARSDVLVFMNPDASFTPGAVKTLAQQVRASGSLVGPRINDEDGFDQTRARFWSTPLSILGEVCLPTVLTKVFFQRDIPPEYVVYRYGGPVPYVQGTCMAVSANTFRLVGGFDERLFLYHEEELLARRLESIGVSVILAPRAVVTHLGGRSTSQVREFAARQYYRSAALIMLAQHPPLIAVPAVMTLWLVLMLMAASTPLRMRIGFRTHHGRTWYRSGAAGAIAGLFGRVVTAPTDVAATNVIKLVVDEKAAV